MFEIGNSLREARLRRSIEIAQAEQATKIRGKYLRALEEERFDLLPAQTYVKGFLRTYSDYLGLDGQLYVDEYNSRFVAGEDSDRLRRSRVRPERRNRTLETNVVLLVLAVISIVTVVVISAWKTSGSGTTVKTIHRTHAARKHVAVSHADLEIAAVRGQSYVAVHRGGPAGKILFEGTVNKGKLEPFTGNRFWLSVSSPENLTIRVHGKLVPLSGKQPLSLTVTPSGVHSD